jgi:hypothetical protein
MTLILMKSQSNLISLHLPKAWDFSSLNRSSDRAQQKTVKSSLSPRLLTSKSPKLLVLITRRAEFHVLCPWVSTEEVEAAYAMCVNALKRAAALPRPGHTTMDVYRAIVNAIEGAGYQMGLHTLVIPRALTFLKGLLLMKKRTLSYPME